MAPWQGAARLPVLRHGPDVRVRPDGAGRAHLGTGRPVRGRRPGVPRDADRQAPGAHRRHAREDATALPHDVAAGHRPDPPRGAQALAQARSLPPQAAVRSRPGSLSRDDRSRGGLAPRAPRAAWPRQAARPDRPGAAARDLGPVAPGRRRADPPHARRRHAQVRRRGRRAVGNRRHPQQGSLPPHRDPRPDRHRRGLRRRGLGRRRPARRARDHGAHGRGAAPPPARVEPRAAAGAATPPAAAQRPGERQARHRLPLRHRERPLRAVPRSVPDLLVRVLRGPGRHPRAGATEQVPAHLREARPRRPTTTCWRSAAAGAASPCTRRASAVPG